MAELLSVCHDSGLQSNATAKTKATSSSTQQQQQPSDYSRVMKHLMSLGPSAVDVEVCVVYMYHL
jgi:hypothetical protein